MEVRNGTHASETKSQVVVNELADHESAVLHCAWSSLDDVLATSSLDGSVRLWSVGEDFSATSFPKFVDIGHTRKLAGNEDPLKSAVFSLAWKADGLSLATSCDDGYVRLFEKDGALIRKFDGNHKDSIVTLKWNPSGSRLLTGSWDHTAIVWCARSGECVQKFAHHTNLLNDVDWQSDDVFATCSSDKLIHVCRVGEEEPVKTLKGHQSYVRSIQWDPEGVLLASASDDKTVKFWKLDSDTCVRTLEAHSGEIGQVRWSPTGPGTNVPNQRRMLASASDDATVRVWDAETGGVLNTLEKHKNPVNSIAFSPDGRLIASVSLRDSIVHVWDTTSGSHVYGYVGAPSDEAWNGDLCSWNRSGDKLAVGFMDGAVSIFDLYKLK